jgi:GAF domain-containing protein
VPIDEDEQMAGDRIGLGEHALRRLLEVGRTLVSELDLESVLRRLLETARELTGARYAALGILDEGREELERFITGLSGRCHGGGACSVSTSAMISSVTGGTVRVIRAGSSL